jgi:Spy/CpxP family protein refolding chaperone
MIVSVLIIAGLASAQATAQVFPDEARKPLVEVLGGSFFVFRDKVQEELKLSDEQKQKLQEKFPEYVEATMKVFEKIKEATPEEGEKTMQDHRKESGEKLSALLKDVLDARQQHRLFQLQLQQAGVFALMGENPAFKSLKIADEQRKRFKEVIQEMEKKIEPLAKEGRTGGNPEETMAKAKKVRKEHEGKIEAILTDAQKKQWKELLGKPFDLND